MLILFWSFFFFGIIFIIKLRAVAWINTIYINILEMFEPNRSSF